MALFESYERRIDKINAVLGKYGIGSIEEAEKIKLCEIITETKADYIKTSTGFASGGATIADILLFKEHIGAQVKIKAAGGIRTIETAQALLSAGADRLGASSLLAQIKAAQIKE